MVLFIELFSCVIEILIGYFYFSGVLEKKDTPLKRLLYIVIAIVFNILRSYLYLPFLANILVTVLIWLFITMTCCLGKLTKKIYFVVIGIAAIIVSDILTALCSSILFDITYDGAEFTLRTLGIIMTNSFLFVISAFIIYISKRKYRQLTLKYNILMILCPLVSIFLLMLLDVYITQSQNPYYPLPVFAVVGLGYINLMVFDFFDYYEKGVRITAVDTMLKANEENYKLLESNEQELHILRHDILRHAAEIKEMITHNNIEGAKQYFEEVNQIVRNTTCFSRTGHLALDTVLNIEGKKAVHAGIQYDLKLNVEDKIHISSVDLIKILSNAIDNAIEACSETEEKYILVSFKTDKEKIRISIENTTSESVDKNPKLRTTKADLTHHGFGIQSMKTAIENYDGLIDFIYEAPKFICRIELKNIEKR